MMQEFTRNCLFEQPQPASTANPVDDAQHTWVTVVAVRHLTAVVVVVLIHSMWLSIHTNTGKPYMFVNATLSCVKWHDYIFLLFFFSFYFCLSGRRSHSSQCVCVCEWMKSRACARPPVSFDIGRQQCNAIAMRIANDEKRTHARHQSTSMIRR